MAVLIFKPLEKCNSNCLYCDTITKRNDAVMSLDLLETVFRRIGEFLNSKPREQLVFTWHGGEICLLGADYLNKAIEFQDRYCGQTKHRIIHSAQSNLTLLTQEHVDAFRSLGMTNIGTSFEPIPNIRGFGPQRDSDTYNRNFFRGAALLEKNGLKWGVIYTTHRKSLERPLEIFSYLVNMNPGQQAPRFNFVRCFNDSTADFAITEEEFGNFLGAIFPTFWKNIERYGPVQPFAWYIDAAVHKNAQLVCDMEGDCAHRWLFIGPEGEAAHCGVAGDYEVFKYGTIMDRSIDEILADPNRVEIARRRTVLPQTHCKGCRFWGVCHGGCPVGSFKVHNTLFAPSPSCGATRLFLEKYFEPVTGYRIDMPPPAL